MPADGAGPAGGAAAQDGHHAGEINEEDRGTKDNNWDKEGEDENVQKVGQRGEWPPWGEAALKDESDAGGAAGGDHLGAGGAGGL